jgi:hypothetical protein
MAVRMLRVLLAHPGLAKPFHTKYGSSFHYHVTSDALCKPSQQISTALQFAEESSCLAATIEYKRLCEFTKIFNSFVGSYNADDNKDAKSFCYFNIVHKHHFKEDENSKLKPWCYTSS